MGAPPSTVVDGLNEFALLLEGHVVLRAVLIRLQHHLIFYVLFLLCCHGRVGLVVLSHIQYAGMLSVRGVSILFSSLLDALVVISASHSDRARCNRPLIHLIGEGLSLGVSGRRHGRALRLLSLLFGLSV